MTTNHQLRLQRRIAVEYQLEAAKYHADFRTLRDDGGFALDTLAYYQTQAEAHYAVARIVMGSENPVEDIWPTAFEERHNGV